MTRFTESEIRSRRAHDRYLELVRQEAATIARDASALECVCCPACASVDVSTGFEKAGFRYLQCAECSTLYVSPRPRLEVLTALYTASASTQYWVDEFFRPVAEARRSKIFRPRAQFLAEQFPALATGRVADVGAGFGLFLEELRKLWPEAVLLAIEPSPLMADILRTKHIEVREVMLEQVAPEEPPFDIITAFEVFEHLHEPISFLRATRRLLRPGGLLYMTTLNGLGFDIQVHWASSRAVSPPHHLNFANPGSMKLLLERTGFEPVEIDTPGQLDWDIVEGALWNDHVDPGRFFRTVAERASDEVKAALQDWLRLSGFSSHMRAVARRVG